MTSEQPAGSAPQDQSGPHEVVLRRSPKYATFMALGAAIGIVVALVATVSQGVDTNYTFGQVLGFLLLACVIVGLFVGGVVAIILDRIVSRHAHTVLVQRVSERPGAQAAPVVDVEPGADAAAPSTLSDVNADADADAHAAPEAPVAPPAADRLSDIAAPATRAQVRR